MVPSLAEYRLFDTHCHVDEEKFDLDRDETLLRMKEEGIARYAVIGTDRETSFRAADFAASHEGCVAAVGFHPHEASKMVEEDSDILRQLCSRSEVRAIGEIGLDYFYDLSPRDVQRKVMVDQIRLAYEVQKPVVYHIRDAHGEAMQLLKENKAYLTGGIIHCYSSSWEMAKEYMNLGFYISFAGPVTFKKAPSLQETAMKMPLDRLLIETDSPYLAPEPKRGRRNEPTYVKYICEKIAALRGMDAAELAEITYQNGLRVYELAE